MQTSAAPITALKSSVRDDYDDWHGAIASCGEDQAEAPWHELARKALAGVDLRGKKVLEIACGRGGFSRWLAEQGAKVTAADYSPVAVELSRARLCDFPSCEAKQEDLQSLSFPDGAFDVVISLETLEHLPSPITGLRELVRVTKHGGVLLLTGPNYLGSTGLYRIYRRLIGRPFTECGQPINQLLFLPWQVVRMRAAGCEIDRVDGVGHYLYWPGRRPLRLASLDRFRWLTRWFALHGLILAKRRPTP
jgi:ubiquinone/menaquinone biosynthesis C-methylase UbiE